MSDDSSEDDSAYSTTNVLLGYASKEPTGDDISFLGGTPSWLADIKPSYDLVLCKTCKSPLSQLLQLNGELPDQFPNHDRQLHILACRKKACSRKPGSIRALRATRHIVVDTAAKKQQQQAAPTPANITLGNDIFGATLGSSVRANPFSKTASSTSSAFMSSKPTEPLVPLYSTAAQTNHTPEISQQFQPWPPEQAGTDNFPKLYLDADYESLDDSRKAEVSSFHQVSTIEDETVEASGGSASAKEEAEVFESDLDRTFQKFADRLSQNPEQVLRYEFKGNPLLYSAVDEVGKIFSSAAPAKASTAKRGLPGCSNCGKSRTFELQLTPHTIIELEGDDLSLDGMEWGTIIVGVCAANCQARGIGLGDVGYIEEWVGIQWEERKK